MLFFYRLPGFVACVALTGQVGGMIACVSGFFPFFESFTLTIPGIAGIILSIGMGVDANVITAERIKEELRARKTLDGAIDAGYDNGFSAILDGNVTVIIVSVLLMGAFGPSDSLLAKLVSPLLFMFDSSITGSIYSFGFTLLMGVVFNFVMGVWASRFMLKSLSGYKFLRRPTLYGGVAQ
jgi:preprotein translocase subunit SecD